MGEPAERCDAPIHRWAKTPDKFSWFCTTCGLIVTFPPHPSPGSPYGEQKKAAPVWENRPPWPRAVQAKKPKTKKPAHEQPIPKVAALIERDGLTCFYYEHPLLDPRANRSADQSPWWPTIDHLLPRSAGGTNALENLVLACKACNGKKGAHVRLLVELINDLRARLTSIENTASRTTS